MAGVDLTKLNKLKQQLEERSSGDIMYASKINGSLEIRVMPPHPNMDGIPFFEVTKWNIGKHILTSPKTFGRECPIEAEVEAAKAWVETNKHSKDPNNKAYAKELSVLLNKWDECKEKIEYLIPILVLLPEGDNYKATGPKYLSCGATIVKGITEVMSNVKYMNGTPNGLTDRVRGRNFTITKTGTGKETKYVVQPWPNEMEMPEAFYAADKQKDPFTFVKKGLKSDAHLSSVARNYLYGDEIIEDTTSQEDAAPQEEDTQEVTQEVNAPADNTGGMVANVGFSQTTDPMVNRPQVGGPANVPGSVGHNRPAGPQGGPASAGIAPTKKRNIGSEIRKMNQ